METDNIYTLEGDSLKVSKDVTVFLGKAKSALDPLLESMQDNTKNPETISLYMLTAFKEENGEKASKTSIHTTSRSEQEKTQALVIEATAEMIVNMANSFGISTDEVMRMIQNHLSYKDPKSVPSVIANAPLMQGYMCVSAGIVDTKGKWTYLRYNDCLWTPERLVGKYITSYSCPETPDEILLVVRIEGRPEEAYEYVPVYQAEAEEN